jgi:hypothetical protein
LGNIQSGDIQSGNIQKSYIQSGDIQSGDIQSGDIQSGDIMPLYQLILKLVFLVGNTYTIWQPCLHLRKSNFSANGENKKKKAFSES